MAKNTNDGGSIKNHDLDNLMRSLSQYGDELEILIEQIDPDRPGELPVLSARQHVFEFLEQHYGPVEIERGQNDNFLVCWYRRQVPEKPSKGDAFFYAFAGKSYLVIEVPCGFVDEVEADSLLQFTAVWGRGRRGQAHTFKNVVSTILVEEYPEHALVMIDQLIEAARTFEAEIAGIDLPENLFPMRKSAP